VIAIHQCQLPDARKYFRRKSSFMIPPARWWRRFKGIPQFVVAATSK
jgi:hypothetical protein